jgi:hypothetical protein
MKHESVRSVWDWNTGEPSIFRPLQASAKHSQISTRTVEKAREDGADWTGGVVVKRQRYSPAIENAADGQRAADKRDALRRGGI